MDRFETRLQFQSKLATKIYSQIASIDAVTGLNPRTVDHTLRKLADMNKVERFGKGRATRYRVV